jgi:hypothetical protein
MDYKIFSYNNIRHICIKVIMALYFPVVTHGTHLCKKLSLDRDPGSPRSLRRRRCPRAGMLRGAISRLGARLRLHADPSPASPRLRVLSTRRGKRSSPTLSPADCDDEGPLRGLFVLSRDPECPPRLLVVQPRLRPGSLLESKLAEALNLANSLEERRDGFYHSEFGAKGAPPHLVVQNPASRGRSHAGIQLYASPFLVLSSTVHWECFWFAYVVGLVSVIYSHYR